MELNGPELSHSVAQVTDLILFLSRTKAHRLDLISVIVSRPNSPSSMSLHDHGTIRLFQVPLGRRAHSGGGQGFEEADGGGCRRVMTVRVT